MMMMIGVDDGDGGDDDGDDDDYLGRHPKVVRGHESYYGR